MFSPPSPTTLSNNKTFYEILEVGKDASEEEIKKAYRRLSLLYHPDRNPTDEAKNKIRDINTSYETLSDKEARKRYDFQLSGGGGGGGGGGGAPHQMFFHTNFGNGGEHVDFANISNIFDNIFNAGGGINPDFFHQHIHQQIHKPMPIVVNIEINFTQSYTGCVFPVEINKIEACDGERVRKTETVYVTIPEGIDNNEVIIIREKGNESPNGTRGDVKIFISIKKNETNEKELLFNRHGLDLIIKKEITLKEALCGFSFNIKHLSGSNYCIKNTTIVSPNQKQLIPKLGMKREGNIGNLIIDYTIVFPTELDETKKEQIREIL